MTSSQSSSSKGFTGSLLEPDEVKRLVGQALTSSMITPTQLPSFSAEPTEDVELWIDKFEALADAAFLDDASRLAKLRLCLEGPARIWYKLNIENNCSAPQKWAGRTTEPGVRELLREYAKPFAHTDHLKTDMRTRKQVKGERLRYYLDNKKFLCDAIDKSMSFERLLKECYKGMLTEYEMPIRAAQPTNFKELITVAERVEKDLLDTSDKRKTDSNSSNNFDTMVSILKEALGESIKAASKVKDVQATNNDTKPLVPVQQRFDRNENRTLNGSLRCHFCGKTGHKFSECFKNPSSLQFRPPANQFNRPQWQHTPQGQYNQEHQRLPYRGQFRGNGQPRFGFNQQVSQHNQFQPNYRNHNQQTNIVPYNQGYPPYQRLNQHQPARFVPVQGNLPINQPYNQTYNSPQQATQVNNQNVSFVNAIDVLRINASSDVLATDRKIGHTFKAIVCVSGMYIDALVDTGSLVTIISEKTARNLGRKYGNTLVSSLRGAGGHELAIYGELDLEVMVITKDKKLRTITIAAIVANMESCALLLGTDFCAKAEPTFDFSRGIVSFTDEKLENTVMFGQKAITGIENHSNTAHQLVNSKPNSTIVEKNDITINQETLTIKSNGQENSPSAVKANCSEQTEEDIKTSEKSAPIKENVKVTKSNEVHGHKSKSIRAHCALTTELMPNCLTTMYISAAQKREFSDSMAVVYGSGEKNNELTFHIVEALVSVNDGSALCEVINRTSEAITIHAGTWVANIECVNQANVRDFSELSEFMSNSYDSMSELELEPLQNNFEKMEHQANCTQQISLSKGKVLVNKNLTGDDKAKLTGFLEKFIDRLSFD